jgi:hypothetical protein
VRTVLRVLTLALFASVALSASAHAATVTGDFWVTYNPVLLTIVATLLIAVVPPATATPITNCKGTLAPGHSHFTNDPVQGVVIAANVTTRGVSCAVAKRFIITATRRASNFAQSTFRQDGFRCRTRTSGEESADTRCTRGPQVIRWQSGA